MERSKTDARPLEVMSHEDIDPWNEFLSESSAELQLLQQAQAGRVTEETIDRSASAGADNAGLPSPGATEIVATPTDIVRVHFASAPAATGAPRDDADVAAETSPSSTVPAPERETKYRPRALHLAPFVSRREPAEIASPHVPPPIPRSTQAIPLVPDAPSPIAEPRVTNRPAVAAETVATAISLTEILTRQVPVHWSEAIAAVEDLCALLAATNEATPLVPGLADILLSRDGHVIVRPGAAGDPDVATLGRTLHALLASTTTPLPLRLFVTASISSDRYKSVALFADALSYYAAPGRSDLIQTLYKRAAATAAMVPLPPAVERAATPARAAQKPFVSTPHDRRSHAIAWAVGIFAGVSIGTGAALWMWPVPGGDTRQSMTSAPATSAQSHDDWTPGRVIVDRNLKRKASKGAGTRAGQASSKSVAAAPRAATALTARPVSSSPQGPTARTPQPATGEPEAPLPNPPRPPASRDVRSIESASLPLPATPSQSDVVIYSDADRDVTPPVLLSRRPLPPPDPSSTDSQVANTVELVIDQTGRVQTARMTARPTRLTDMNAVQEAKLLRFTPAMKDGHPVLFRYFLRSAGAPR